MAKITYSDFFDYSNDRTVKEAIRLIKEMETAYTELVGSIKGQNKRLTGNIKKLEKDMAGLAKSMSNVNLESKAGQETAKKTAKIAETQASIYEQQSKQLKANAIQIKKLNAEIKRLQKSRQSGQKTQRKTVELTRQEMKARLELQQRQARTREELKIEIALQRKNIGTMEKARLELRKLTLQRNRLSAADGKNAKELERLTGLMKVQETKIRSLSSALEKQRINIGNYQSALQNMGPALMMLPGPMGRVAASATMLGGAFKAMFSPLGAGIAIFASLMALMAKVVGHSRKLQDASAELAAVLGTTRTEITKLTEDAKRLGATTAFTTEQVIELQTAYAKLGFGQQQIIDMTEATLNLAIATQRSSEDVATFIGSTLRQFNLMSTEATRVADVAAKAFSSSALDFEKLSVGLSIVGKAANVSNVSLEGTVAILGTLANSGIDASTAATSLRNIFVELGKKGITYEDALKKINTSNDKLLTAFQLFGKRGAVAAIVLAEMQDETKKLQTTIEDAGGAVDKFAKEKLNTLSGSITLLQSAWSGLLESIDDGNGVFSKLAKEIVDFARQVLTAFKWLIDFDKKVISSITNIRDFVSEKLGFKKAKENTEKLGVGFGNLSDAYKAFGDQVEKTNKKLSRTEQLENELKKRIAELEKTTKDSADEVENLGNKSESAAPKLQDLKSKMVDLSDVSIGDDDKSVENLEGRLRRMLSAWNDYHDQEIAQYEAAQKQKEEIQKQANEIYVQAGVAAINGVFEYHRASMMNEMSMLQKQKDYELTLAGQNADKQYEIKRKYEQKERELRIKQAKADKTQAMFNIAINTAVAIMKTYSQLGPLLGTPLAIAMGVLGAVQLAMVAARPIPQFAEGTEDSPEGLAVVGEKGTEVGIKDGKATVYDRPTLTYLKRGTKIIPNHELETLGTREDLIGMNNQLANEIRIKHDERMTTRLSRAMMQNAEVVAGAIKNKPETKVVIDKEGVHQQIKRGSLWEKYLEENFYN